MFRQNHINQKENAAGKGKSSPPQQASATLPPSLSPSPSHEFSFTISLHHRNCTAAPSHLDLAPADDIFFHGHLLPLDKLQSVSNSEPNDDYNNSNSIKSKHKPSLSSLLGLTKWLRRSDDEEGRRKKKEKKSFDLRCCWKKVGPFLFFKWEKGKRRELNRRPCSFSGQANDSREGSARWRWLGEFSAPASIWTSPTNSGHHLSTTAVAATSSEESTMVELQNAVQAAIAHCKNSIAIKEDKFS